MTEQELEELLTSCPKLYHMAEYGSWPSIKERGLLSTSAILDLYGIEGEQRVQIEECRRPTSVTLRHQSLPSIVIRDQIPMTDWALKGCLQDDLQPRDWYRLLNGKVFFWPSEERLRRLLGAKAYRNTKHDILEVDSKAILRDFRPKITLSPINSGSTLFNPRLRGKGTFANIEGYDYASRPRDNRVAEFAIEHSVPNIGEYVDRAFEMQGHQVIREL